MLESRMVDPETGQDEPSAWTEIYLEVLQEAFLRGGPARGDGFTG